MPRTSRQEARLLETLPNNFFLTSTEGYGLDVRRLCQAIKRIRARGREDYLLVSISPKLDGVHFGKPGLTAERLLLATRLGGTSLFPVSSWPLHVYVARPLIENVELHDALNDDELELIGWGEIHR